jgi:predicted branched-subunit amino acid permease
MFLPLAPAMIAFSAALGAQCAQRGFGLLDTMLLAGVFYAGVAQGVIIQLWPHPMTLAAFATLFVLVVTINMRLVLLGASLRPWLGSLPGWQSYPMMFLVTDPSWLLSVRYRAAGGNDAGVYLGVGVAMWFTWTGSGGLGYALGSFISDPRRYALDLVMPIFMAAMLVSLWRGPRMASAWGVAGLVAFVIERVTPGGWYVVAGTLAGCLVGLVVDDRE